MKKQTSKAVVILGMLAGLLLSAGPVAWGQVYSFRTIDVPGSAATLAAANNNNGQIVGEYTTGPCCLPAATGFVITRGAFKPVAYPGATFTTAGGLNNKGEI